MATTASADKEMLQLADKLRNEQQEVKWNKREYDKAAAHALEVRKETADAATAINKAAARERDGERIRSSLPRRYRAGARISRIAPLGPR